DEEVVVGGGDVDPARQDRVLVARLQDRTLRVTRKEPAQPARRRVRAPVLRDDDRGWEVGRHRSEQPLERSEPAPRRTDGDDVVPHPIFRKILVPGRSSSYRSANGLKEIDSF